MEKGGREMEGSMMERDGWVRRSGCVSSRCRPMVRDEQSVEAGDSERDLAKIDVEA